MKKSNAINGILIENDFQDVIKLENIPQKNNISENTNDNIQADDLSVETTFGLSGFNYKLGY